MDTQQRFVVVYEGDDPGTAAPLLVSADREVVERVVAILRARLGPADVRPLRPRLAP